MCDSVNTNLGHMLWMCHVCTPDHIHPLHGENRGFAKALLHARDALMTQLLRSNTFASDRTGSDVALKLVVLVQTFAAAPLTPCRTVCVVGMAHMDGIVRRYTDPNWKERKTVCSENDAGHVPGAQFVNAKLLSL